MMKVCFSTLGCPRWPFGEIFSTAKDLGLDGIEIRGVGDELYAPRIPEFSDESIPATKAKFAAAGLAIPILTANSALAIPDRAARDFDEALAYIDLAGKLGTPYIRVMSSANPQPEACDLTLCADRYRALCEAGVAGGVTPLIETNGELADSARMARFMGDVGHENAGVLWDIHHPFRFFGEAPETTVQNIGAYIRHVHVKDSVMEGGRVAYRMMGYGDVPVLDCLRALQKTDYDGFVSLEWVKRWNPDLQEPGIVFAHFQNYMAHLLRQL